MTALRSMTGFGQARRAQDGWALRVHVRSVNHRYLDLRLRLPEGFEALEPAIRNAVRVHIRRGHVEVALRFEPAAGAVCINRELATAYLRAAEQLRIEFGFAAEPDLAAVLRLPGVIAPAEALDEEQQEELGRRVVACVNEALERADEMRRAEGSVLAGEIRARLEHINGVVTKLEPLAGRVPPAYARRLEARIAALLGNAPVDAARIAQEAAVLAERSDITEELTRLRSHLGQCGALLGDGRDAGKKLDFLLQEMQREANTILSKTPGGEDEGLEITALALDIKAEIEKLREQVQNIE